jgi:predicted anti-sigma-YlaC factor YlaD
MNEDGKVRNLSCARALDFIHRRLDGDPLDRASVEWLETHLSECAECSAADAELGEVQQVLRNLTTVPLADEALDEVWERTTRSARKRLRFDWRVAAAAAVLTVVFIGMWQVIQPPMQQTAVVTPEERPSPEKLARATAEARLALNVVASALHRSETAAFGEVLGERVSPALRKIPIRRPAPSVPDAKDEREKGENDV